MATWSEAGPLGNQQWIAYRPHVSSAVAGNRICASDWQISEGPLSILADELVKEDKRRPGVFLAAGVVVRDQNLQIQCVSLVLRISGRVAIGGTVLRPIL